MDETAMKQCNRLLITGASGFTGQHACVHFARAGFAVTAAARKTAYTNDQVQVEYCNLTNYNAVKQLVQKAKPNYLLHLAGQNHVGQSRLDPVSSFEANSLSTLYLLEALRHENPSCKIVVAGSALQFNPNDISTLEHPYSLSKTVQVLIAQAWAALYNMHIVIAIPSNLIGPGFSNGVCAIFAQKITDMEEHKTEKILEVHNVNAQRDFIDVRDAVHAYEILLTKGKSGETYEIASGKSRSLAEIACEFKKIATVDFQIKSEKNGQVEQSVNMRPLKLMCLGWKPAIPLSASLTDILNFYRSMKTKRE
ncbi:MAG: NAD-dependent epimerase/dehydratase family protein [Ectobacillus sp.]